MSQHNEQGASPDGDRAASLTASAVPASQGGIPSAAQAPSQRARDAAFRLLYARGDRGLAYGVKAGKCDLALEVQAFARFEAEAVMVPREPTPEMMDAGLYHMPSGTEWADLYTAWQSMFDSIVEDGGTTALLAASHADRQKAHTEANAMRTKLVLCADKIASLTDALETLMVWVKAWDCDFVMDDEWPADEARINAALAKARGQ